MKENKVKRKIHKFDKHHILPRSLFEEHKNSEFNIVNLQYREDHNINNKDDIRILKREYRKINKIT